MDLHELVKVITEEAVSSVRAVDEGLEMMWDRPKETIVLYDPSKITFSPVIRVPVYAIVGEISYNTHDDPDLGTVHEVTSSAARSGYGPLIYDALLSDGWTIPDRSSVSEKAERVWVRYRYGRDDVEKVPVPPRLERDPEEMTKREREVLNSAYALVRPPGGLDVLLGRYEDRCKSLGPAARTLRSKLLVVSADYFSERYAG